MKIPLCIKKYFVCAIVSVYHPFVHNPVHTVFPLISVRPVFAFHSASAVSLFCRITNSALWFWKKLFQETQPDLIVQYQLWYEIIQRCQVNWFVHFPRGSASFLQTLQAPASWIVAAVGKSESNYILRSFMWNAKHKLDCITMKKI